MNNVLGRTIILGVLAALLLIGSGEWQARPDRAVVRLPTGQDPGPSIPTIAPVGTALATEARLRAVEAIALDYTEWHFPPLSGTPEVVYIRPVTPDEFAGIGISWWPPYGNDEPPMWIVLVHGDMDPPSKAIVGSPAERPHLDFVFYLVDEVYGVRLSGIAPGGGGLGCLFNDARLPGGFDLCTGQYLNRRVIVYAHPTPTRLPPGTVLGGVDYALTPGNVLLGIQRPTVISTITTTRVPRVVPLPHSLAMIVATPTAGPSPTATLTPLVTATPRPTRTPLVTQGPEVIR